MKNTNAWRRLGLGIALLFIAATAPAAPTLIGRDLPPGQQIPAAAQPGPGFDVERATQAYLDLLSPQQRQLSDAYFEGGYWLQLWEALYGIGVSALLLWGFSQRLRDFAERRSHRPWLQSALYALLFIVTSFVLTLPLSIYTDWIRERQYGLSQQAFGGWFGDQLKGLMVSAILGSVALVALYAALRRTGRRWWLWASGLTGVFMLFVMLIQPVFVAPLFNDYRPLPPGPVRDAVLSLARANGIPTDHLEWFDASKQTTRISANVSGLWGTTRVNLNDNLLTRTSLPEIRAVLGHEMGHYVLNHALRLSVYFALEYTLMFAALHWLFDRALARWGPRLGLRDRDDPAALPLATALMSVLMLLLTPVSNSITRQAEAEADAFGLNAAREPQAFALVAMRLSTYRKIHPGTLEEIVFYDHPSGYQRVHRSMIWQQENLPGVTAGATGTAATR